MADQADKQVTRWDETLERINRINTLVRELKEGWPGRPSFLTSEWLENLEGSSAGLRQVVISRVDGERVERYGDAARRL